MQDDMARILLGVAAGLAARGMLLRVAHRAYPSSPAGILIHLTVAAAAAALGAVAVPALVRRDFVAMAFLALGVQQLREVRRMERQSLLDLDRSEPVPRGEAYIDGVAKRFEARNYAVLLVALATVAGTYAGRTPAAAGAGGLLAGLAAFTGVRRLLHQPGIVADLAQVELAPVTAGPAGVRVGPVEVALGEDAGDPGSMLGVLLRPRSPADLLALTHPALHQAVAHEVARRAGIRGPYGWGTNPGLGTLAFCAQTVLREPAPFLDAVREAPLLEGLPRPGRRTRR